MLDPSEKVSDHGNSYNVLHFDPPALADPLFYLVYLYLQGSDQNKKYPEVISPKETKKTCADCGTSKTSLWRGGPAGPKVTPFVIPHF